MERSLVTSGLVSAFALAISTAVALAAEYLDGSQRSRVQQATR